MSSFGFAKVVRELMIVGTCAVLALGLGTSLASAQGLVEGDGTARRAAAQGPRLFGRWADGCYYPGRIESLAGEAVLFRFDDGDAALLTPDEVVAHNVGAGTPVECKWQGMGIYFPGRVARRAGDVIHVRYDDGDEEITTIGRIRLRLVRRVPAPELQPATTGDYEGLSPEEKYGARASGTQYGQTVEDRDWRIDHPGLDPIRSSPGYK